MITRSPPTDRKLPNENSRLTKPYSHSCFFPLLVEASLEVGGSSAEFVLNPSYENYIFFPVFSILRLFFSNRSQTILVCTSKIYQDCKKLNTQAEKISITISSCTKQTGLRRLESAQFYPGEEQLLLPPNQPTNAD